MYYKDFYPVRKGIFLYFLNYHREVNIRKLIYILLIIFSTNFLSAQNITIGFGWGLIEFQNKVVEKNNFDILSYNVDGDYKFSLAIKYQLPDKNYRFKGGYYYSEIRGDGVVRNINPAANSIPLQVQVINNLTTITIGLEYLFEVGDFRPYFGLDMLFGLFGDSELYRVDQQGKTRIESFPGKTRIGLGTSGGIGYTLFPGIELDLNFAYSSLNLLGKEDYEENILTSDLSLSLYFAF